MTTPMEPGLKLTKEEGELLEDATLFRQLVGSLFYLTIPRLCRGYFLVYG